MEATSGSQGAEHPTLTPRIPACDNCKDRKTKCDRGAPCSSCLTANLTCRATRTKPEKRQRVLISARYDEALESVDNRLQEVLQTVTALQRDVQRQPGSAQGQAGLQRAADFPAGLPQNVLPAIPATGEGFKGQPSFESQVRQMAGTLGTMPANPMLHVSHHGASTSPSVQKILESCATPEAIPFEASKAHLRPFFEQHPEFANHTLPPSDAVLKMLRLAQGEKQRFFVDVGIFDEVEFANMCRQVFFAIDPYTLTTWSIVNAGLFYMFLGLKPQRYHELGLQGSEVGNIIGILARNVGASVEAFRICSEPAIETCQALTLLGTFCMKSGQLAKAWRLMSTSARMCIDLGLHRMQAGVRGSEDSLKRWHIFWYIYVYEKGLAFTVGRASSIPDYDVSTERPRYPDDMPGVPGRTYTAMLELAMLEGEIQPQLFSASAAHLPLDVRVQKAGEFRMKVNRIQRELNQMGSDLVSHSAFSDAAALVHLLLYSLPVVVCTAADSDISNQQGHSCAECTEAARQTLSLLVKIGKEKHEEHGHYKGYAMLLNIFLSFTPFTPYLTLAIHVVADGSAADLELLASVNSLFSIVAEGSSLVRHLHGICTSLYQFAESRARQCLVGSEPVGPDQLTFDDAFGENALPLTGSDLSSEVSPETMSMGDWQMMLGGFDMGWQQTQG